MVLHTNPTRSEFEFGHTKSSCKLGMPLKSWVDRSRVATSVGLETWVGLGALLVE